MKKTRNPDQQHVPDSGAHLPTTNQKKEGR